MTREDLDPYLGRALAADGIATAVAGGVGGSPTTTYAENIGVMAATRVYSTAAYWVAALVAVLIGFCPKFGAVVAATPGGVLGGITVVLYGMIGLLGARIWVENRVDFSRPEVLVPLAAGIVIGVGDVALHVLRRGVERDRAGHRRRGGRLPRCCAGSRPIAAVTGMRPPARRPLPTRRPPSPATTSARGTRGIALQTPQQSGERPAEQAVGNALRPEPALLYEALVERGDHAGHLGVVERPRHPAALPFGGDEPRARRPGRGPSARPDPPRTRGSAPHRARPPPRAARGGRSRPPRAAGGRGRAGRRRTPRRARPRRPRTRGPRGARSGRGRASPCW